MSVSDQPRPSEDGSESRTDRDGNVLTLSFTRPQQHNALTPSMYQAVARACETARTDTGVQCLVLRGTSGASFAAGTDINHFQSVHGAADGIAYENSIETVLDALNDLPVPTLAVIEGAALGGGLLLAAACDLRICTPQASFGVPIARTVGNCLSPKSYGLLADRLGGSRTLQLLLTADPLTADAAETAGFVIAVASARTLEARVRDITSRLCGHAPLTMRAAKAADRDRRLGTDEAHSYVARCYASADFTEGVQAFLQRRTPSWRGA